jgi:hypothetical protein
MKRKVTSAGHAAQAKTPVAGKPEAKPEAKRAVVLPRRLTVKQLADILGVSGIDAIKCLMRNGVMANIRLLKQPPSPE